MENKVSKLFKERRYIKRLTQKQVAELVGLKCVQTLSNIENFNRRVNPKLVNKYSSILGIKKSVLINAMTEDYRQTIVEASSE